MRNHRVSRLQAAQLIATAVRDGWTKKVEAMRRDDGKPWCHMVCLTKSLILRNGLTLTSCQIIVSFRLARSGWVVSISTFPNYTTKVQRGLWNANYEINKMREEQTWLNERNRQHDAAQQVA